jgi:hypothetical protein
MVADVPGVGTSAAIADVGVGIAVVEVGNCAFLLMIVLLLLFRLMSIISKWLLWAALLDEKIRMLYLLLYQSIRRLSILELLLWLSESYSYVLQQ